MAPNFYSLRIFGNSNALSENFQNFSVSKDKSLSSIGKLLNLPPPYFTGTKTPPERGRRLLGSQEHGFARQSSYPIIAFKKTENSMKQSQLSTNMLMKKFITN